MKHDVWSLRTWKFNKVYSNSNSTRTSSPRCPWNSNFLGIMKAVWWDSMNLCLSARESSAPTNEDNCSAPDCKERCLPSSALQCISSALAMQLWNPKSMHCRDEHKHVITTSFLYVSIVCIIITNWIAIKEAVINTLNDMIINLANSN